ncbi:hypothetical protein [Sabulicella glaciei]|uniref:Uncharacterized protein n=1 Tax=Sabulicella glaciei TaxID=2984948 RepID=A0ABT3NZN4_9PROT|nr:hypothetical protein [Roseococcus sp. MDT2-1-1]MCW8087560.1 hypothetical protein [Roseococcus sp. MDT2-1-1]
MSSISMRELQRISAATIAALPGATPIKSGDETVALLVPIPKADPARVRSFLEDLKGDQVSRTASEEAAITEFLTEIGEA